MDRGVWWATVHRVPNSWTRLKRLGTHAHVYIHVCVCVCVCVCDRILCSHKKDKILPFATTWMNLDSIMLSEISQA